MFRAGSFTASRCDSTRDRTATHVRQVVKQQIGTMIQFLVLSITPLISWWQFQFGYRLIWMPGLLTGAVVLFWIGTRLRESR